MKKIVLTILTEKFLMAAIEMATMNRQVEAEGRTQLNDEEKARIRALTDKARDESLELAKQL